MTVLYVREQGTMVRREGEQVKVTRREGVEAVVRVLEAAPVHELEQVVLYGNVQVTAQAAALLLEKAVDVVFLSRYGKYRGRLSKGGSRYAQLRHAQLRLAGDERWALAVAGGIVRTKLANQRNLLRQVSEQVATPGVVASLRKAASHIEQMRVAGSAPIMDRRAALLSFLGALTRLRTSGHVRACHDRPMRPQPLIAVSDVEASSSFYQAILACTSAHGGAEYERLERDGELVEGWWTT